MFLLRRLNTQPSGVFVDDLVRRMRCNITPKAHPTFHRIRRNKDENSHIVLYLDRKSHQRMGTCHRFHCSIDALKIGGVRVDDVNGFMPIRYLLWRHSCVSAYDPISLTFKNQHHARVRSWTEHGRPLSMIMILHLPFRAQGCES